MTALVDRFFGWLPKKPARLLFLFCACLVALNYGRLDEWGTVGFEHYLSEAIMQTTLFDFAWVLLFLSYFIHLDAKKHGISWWSILPTYPFMPTVGILAYFVVRQRKLRSRSAGSEQRPAQQTA